MGFKSHIGTFREGFRMRLPEILLFSALIVGLLVLLFQKLFHDDYGEIDLAARRPWWVILDPRADEVAYHYNPARKIIFSLLHALGGTTPWPYHAFSLAMHVAYLAGWYLLSGRVAASRPLRMTVVTIVCFATHASEAVFWVGANDQVTAAACYVWALWTGLRFIETGRTVHLIACGLTAAIGLFTMEAVATVPVAIGALSLANRTRIGRPRKAILMLASTLGVIWVTYITLHSVATNRDVLERQGYTLAVGKHNLRNLTFGLQVTMTSATIFHRHVMNGFYDNYYQHIERRLWPRILMLAICAGWLVWRRTRGLVVWLFLSILPYTLRASYPQPPRYYFLPVGIFLMILLATLDALSGRLRVVRLLSLAAMLILAVSTTVAWHNFQHPYYLGLGERAEAALNKCLARSPRSYNGVREILIFGDLPFALRHAAAGAFRASTSTGGRRIANVDYFPDSRRYRYAEREPEDRDYEWHIAVDQTLILPEQEPSDYDQDGRPSIIAHAESRGGDLVWEVKMPHPGFLVWQGGSDATRPESESTLTLVIEEFSVSDPGRMPKRSTRYSMDRHSGRIRLPAPLDNRDWCRVTLVDGQKVGSSFTLLRLEAV